MPLQIECERLGSTALLRLASPERGNAFQPDDFGRLADLMEQSVTEPGVRVLVLTGRGKLFSAGADLGDLGSIGDADLAAIVEEQTGRIAAAFSRSPVPTVVALNGAAAGAACALVLLADIAIAADNARLLFPFARLGLVPDTGLTMLLAEQIGASRARCVLMEGGSISAAKALEWGIVSSLHEPGDLEAATLACAKGLGAMPSGTHAATRSLMRDADVLLAQLRRESCAQADRLREPETRAAIAHAAVAIGARRD